jgi:hypothetical protein
MATPRSRPIISLHIIPALIFTSAAALSTTPSGSSTRRDPSAQVKVWDNVVPTGHSLALHKYAAASGLGHKCFTRPLLLNTNGKSNNIIERTIDDVLTEIERSGRNHDATTSTNQCYVEYWTRMEWRHIEAHADVDENLSKQFDQQNRDDRELQSTYPTTYHKGYGHRYPTFGHVLYLQVGANVKGPTCIFPGRSSGGDLVRSMHDEDGDGDGEKEVPLCIVPAVAGRLLRFDGRDIHAVPRPTDIWMLPFVQGAAQYEPEEIWGRSVVLFNVWPVGEHPPLDVPLDSSGEDREGIQTIDKSFCNSFSDWKEATITPKVSSSSTPESESNQSVKVWLLGNERRRDHPMRTVSLIAPANGGHDAVRVALNEERQVSELLLRRQ